jgi:hypothetical protein
MMGSSFGNMVALLSLGTKSTGIEVTFYSRVTTRAATRPLELASQPRAIPALHGIQSGINRHSNTYADFQFAAMIIRHAVADSNEGARV